MRIIQCTDLHVGLPNENTYGVDVRQNLLDMLEAIQLEKPDYLVVSGDLCYMSGDSDIYRWIKTQLDRTEIPYFVISGNHDDTRLLAEVFGETANLNNDELFFTKRINNKDIIFLDSAKAFHSEEQLDWLNDQLQNAKGEVLIFMHHPPLKAGVNFMDNNYPLKDREKIQKIFFQYSDNVSVFCGHYHIEKTITRKNVMVQITPSCYVQIDQNEAEFKADHYDIAYRIIDVNEKYTTSTVRYLNGNKLV